MQLHDELTASIASLLTAAGETVSVAESSTGGLVSACLLAVPGASAWFTGGSVIYTAVSRRELLGVRGSDVAGLAPLTEPMAAHFAEATRRRLDSTWGLAELGAAGPAGARYGQPPGTSVVAVAGPVSATRLIETGSDDRVGNMYTFAGALLALMDEVLQARR